MKERIIIAVNQSHDINQMKVRALDPTIRSLYVAASGLVNDGAEIWEIMVWFMLSLTSRDGPLSKTVGFSSLNMTLSQGL